MTEKQIMWGAIIVLGLLLVGSLFAKANTTNASTDTPPITPITPVTPVEPVIPTIPVNPDQTVKTFTCETKKVCQLRKGYANWIKTGNQKTCNTNNFLQNLCVNDCLGTCYTIV